MTTKDKPVVTERELQRVIVDYIYRGRWDYYHTANPRFSLRGFPDLVIIRPPEILFVELKAERGRVSPEQKAWLDQLEACGLETHVWRPSDIPEAIERLKRKPE